MNAPAKSIEKADKSHEVLMRSRAPARGLAPSSGLALADIQHSAGNLATQRMLASGMLQRKLSISQPNDAYEEEAEGVARQVVTSAIAPQLRLHRLAADEGSPDRHMHSGADLAQRIEDSRGNGQPLPAGTRSPLEAALGHDFRAVRVHTDSAADSLSRALDAQAFTTGAEIFFRSGAYDPHTSFGKEILAHELTHVMQQAAG